MYYKGKKGADGFFTKEGLYKFFKKQIMAIGNLPLEQQVSLKDLKDTTKARKYEQSAYRESKSRKLALGSVEFLCWLSTYHVAEKIFESSPSVAEIPYAIKTLLASDTCDVKNMLRLFHSNEDFMLDALGVINYADRKQLFAEISKIWFDAKLTKL